MNVGHTKSHYRNLHALHSLCVVHVSACTFCVYVMQDTLLFRCYSFTSLLAYFPLVFFSTSAVGFKSPLYWVSSWVRRLDQQFSVHTQRCDIQTVQTELLETAEMISSMLFYYPGWGSGAVPLLSYWLDCKVVAIFHFPNMLFLSTILNEEVMK